MAPAIVDNTRSLSPNLFPASESPGLPKPGKPGPSKPSESWGLSSAAGYWSLKSKTDCRSALKEDPNVIVVAVDETVRNEETAKSPLTLQSRLTLLHVQNPKVHPIDPILEDLHLERTNALAVECGKVCFHKATDKMKELLLDWNPDVINRMDKAGVKTYLDLVEHLEAKKDFVLSRLLEAVDIHMEETYGVTNLREQGICFLRCVTARDTYTHFTQMDKKDREARVAWVLHALDKQDNISSELLKCTSAIRSGGQLIREGFYDYRSTSSTKTSDTQAVGIELMHYMESLDTGLPLWELICLAFRAMLGHDPKVRYGGWRVDWSEDGFFYVTSESSFTPVLAGYGTSSKLFVAIKNQVMEFELVDGEYILRREQVEIPDSSCGIRTEVSSSVIRGLTDLLNNGGMQMFYGVHAIGVAWFCAQARGVSWGWEGGVLFSGTAVSSMAFLLFATRLFLSCTKDVVAEDLAMDGDADVGRAIYMGSLPSGLGSDISVALRFVSYLEAVLECKVLDQQTVSQLVSLADEWTPRFQFLGYFLEQALDIVFQMLESNKKGHLRKLINQLWSDMSKHGVRRDGEVCGLTVIEFELARERREKEDKDKRAKALAEARAEKKNRQKEKERERKKEIERRKCSALTGVEDDERSKEGEKELVSAGSRFLPLS